MFMSSTRIMASTTRHRLMSTCCQLSRAANGLNFNAVTETRRHQSTLASTEEKLTWKDVNQLKPSVDSPIRSLDPILLRQRVHRGFTVPLMKDYMKNEYPLVYSRLRKSAKKAELVEMLVRTWLDEVEKQRVAQLKTTTIPLQHSIPQSFTHYLRTLTKPFAAEFEATPLSITIKGTPDSLTKCRARIMNAMVEQDHSLTSVYGQEGLGFGLFPFLEVLTAIGKLENEQTGDGTRWYRVGRVVEKKDLDVQIPDEFTVEDYQWNIDGINIDPAASFQNFLLSNIQTTLSFLNASHSSLLASPTNPASLKLSISHGTLLCSTTPTSIPLTPQSPSSITTYIKSAPSSLTLFRPGINTSPLLQSLPNPSSVTSRYEVTATTTDLSKMLKLVFSQRTGTKELELQEAELMCLLGRFRGCGGYASHAFQISVVLSIDVTDKISQETVEKFQLGAPFAELPFSKIVYPEIVELDDVFHLMDVKHVYGRTITVPKMASNTDHTPNTESVETLDENEASQETYTISADTHSNTTATSQTTDPDLSLHVTHSHDLITMVGWRDIEMVGKVAVKGEDPNEAIKQAVEGVEWGEVIEGGLKL